MFSSKVIAFLLFNYRARVQVRGLASSDGCNTSRHRANIVFGQRSRWRYHNLHQSMRISFYARGISDNDCCSEGLGRSDVTEQQESPLSLDFPAIGDKEVIKLSLKSKSCPSIPSAVRVSGLHTINSCIM